MKPTFSTEQYAETLLVAMLNFFVSHFEPELSSLSTVSSFQVGFFGIILNCLSLLTALKSHRFRNSYGTLSSNHSCLNIFILLIYFLWVTPITYV